MVFLLHVGRLPLAISRIVSRNRILCEAAFSVDDKGAPSAVSCRRFSWKMEIGVFTVAQPYEWKTTSAY